MAGRDRSEHWPCSPRRAVGGGRGAHHGHLRRRRRRRHLLRHDREPDRVQPQHALGGLPGHRDGARCGAAQPLRASNNVGAPTPNSDLIVSSELVSTKPETIVYTLNPKAVWSDGVPITATDFKYAWEQQQGDPVVSSPDVSSIAGYRDIASVTGSNGGHTVTVKFKTTFADWQMLFGNLVPAHVMEKVGWNPTCSTVNPAIDLSGGPVQDRVGVGPDDQAGAEPEVVGDAGQRPLHHGARRVLDRAAGPVDGLGLRPGGTARRRSTPGFLTQMTGLPGAQSEVDTSATLLQLDMASSLDAPLSPDLRVAIALTDQPPGPGQPAGQLGGAGSRRWRTATSTCRANRTTSRRRRRLRRRRSRSRRRRPRPP